MAHAAARCETHSDRSCSTTIATRSAQLRWFRWARMRKSAFLPSAAHDADRFHPGMSIDFLARVGDLVAGALARY